MNSIRLLDAGASSQGITRAFAALAMLAVSPVSLAMAQSSSSSDLPPIVVEGQKAKKKPVAAKKSSAPKQVKQAEPVPQAPQADDAAIANATSDGAARPGGNPYANPDAPYKVERSGSGKLTEPLVNTPKTVTAVPKEVIQDKSVTDVRELARQTPGVTINFAEGGNSFNGAYSVRGFSARNDTFVDNLRDPGFALRDVFSIEQVEIYKGPSGGIAGRSTIGGAINFITKQPDLNMSNYEATTTIGTDETVRTTLDVNQVVNSNFAVRGNLMYNQNEVAGRDYVENERWGGFFSATGKLSDSLKVTLDYYHLDSDGTPDWGVPINRAAKKPFTETGLSRDTWYGQKSLDYMEDRSDIGTATIVAKLTDDVTLTNRSRVGQTSNEYIATAPRPAAGETSLGGPITTSNPARDQTVDLLANQTEINWKFRTGSLRHEVLAGVEASREEIERHNFTIVGSGVLNPPNGLGNPNPYRNNRQVTGRTFNYDATITNVGGYIGDTIHLTDQWIVNGGIRVDDFERDQRGATAATTGKVSETLFSWHTGIVFKPIPIASIYAAYSTAESPIGSELDSTDPRYNGISAAFSLDARPQEARSIEVGTKWELFDRRLLATAALFQTDVDHARTGINNAANDDVGEYRLRGVEFGVSGNITDKWSVFGGLVLMESKVFNSGDPANGAQHGDELANLPDIQFSLLSKYQLTDKLSVGGQAIYQSEIHNGFFARALAPEDYQTVDWWRFDAFVEYELTKNIEIELSGVNLTNELYYDALYQQNNSFAYVAPGRAGYLTVKYKY